MRGIMRRAAVAAMLASSIPAAFAGYAYRFTTTTRSAIGEQLLSGRAVVDGPRMRIDFTRGDGIVFQDGSWIFSIDSGKTMMLVDPATRSYSRLELGELLRTAGSAMKAFSNGAMTFSTPSVTTTEGGSGGPIAGFPTRRRTVRSGFDWIVKLIGESVTTHVDIVSESWTTTALPAELMTFIQMPGFETGIESVDRVLRQQSSPNGFPLRQVTTTTTTTGKRHTVTTSETNISAVTKTDVAPGLFVVPGGYRRKSEG
jgi:hypothetical protein